MESKYNNTRQILEVGTSWLGEREITTDFAMLAVNIITTQNITLTVSQSIDGVNYDFVDQFAHEININGTSSTTQFPVKALFIKCSVHNDSIVDIPLLVVTSIFLNTSMNSTSEQPTHITGAVSVVNAMLANDYTFNTLRQLSCDDTGKLLVRF